ncbi:aldehyde dehydrogenase family protein [Pseudomonas amygdali]|uniref:aldehyde dehydrogenase family protein n=1 Tax=Pseudomonas amygdali TaxID=47877 RepID=UPI001FB76777|nr:aldehyde dehydrogenase family protein [Pseudomonas amygdali]
MLTTSTWRSSLAADVAPFPFQVYERRSPGSGEALPTLELLGADAMPLVIATAEEGLVQWQKFNAAQRAEILAGAAMILRAHQQDDAQTLAAETGKSDQEACGELHRAIQTFEWLATQSAVLDTRLDICKSEKCKLEAFPLGIALAVVPWNYPAVVGARKIGAMLLAGCAVIVKPSEVACSPLFAFKAALVAAGMPPATLSIVLGKGEDVVPSLISSERIHAVSFTGSSAVGRQVSALAGLHLLKCVTELGGNAPVILLDDCDIEKTAQALVDYKFELAGQSCNAPDRVYIPAHLNEQFQTALLTCLKRSDFVATGMAPMINFDSVARMEALVLNAIDSGARLLAGGQKLSPNSHYFPATILADVPEHADVMIDEIFGPILSLSTYQTVGEAIKLANRSRYGFASYVFGADLERAEKIGRALKAGYVVFNGLSGVHPALPVGGIDQSGTGLEGGEMGIQEFLRWRLSRYHDIAQ